MSSVKDRVSVQLIINGVELKTDQSPIDYIHISESCRHYVPVLTFVIQDKSKFLTKNKILVDGSVIKLIIQIDKQKLDYSFRTFSVKESLASGGTSYKVSAYFNIPKFWLQTVTKGTKGSVSDVLKDIALETGLRYEGVTTVENQLWLPLNKKYCEYARYISERGLIDDSSCLQLVVSILGNLRYINISTAFKEFAILDKLSNLPDASKEFKIISDYKVINSSGFFNNLGGYNDTRVSQSILSDGQALKDLSVTKNTKNLDMSETIKSNVSQGKITFSPIDVGNTSVTYEQSLYQNRRLSNLFSSGIELVTPKYINSQVLDIIYADLSKPGVSTVDAISGKYVITSKVLYIEGLNFFQKLELFRHGNNSQQQLGLV